MAGCSLTSVMLPSMFSYSAVQLGTGLPGLAVWLQWPAVGMEIIAYTPAAYMWSSSAIISSGGLRQPIRTRLTPFRP